MKKINHILLLGAFLFVANVQAQNYTDALRYSTEELTGTARFKAMSGAFGALGGDPSAINVNPAASSIFNSSEISFSLNNFTNFSLAMFNLSKLYFNSSSGKYPLYIVG